MQISKSAWEQACCQAKPPGSQVHRMCQHHLVQFVCKVSVLSPILLHASHNPFFHGEPWAFSCTGIAIWNVFLLLQCQVLWEGCLQALPALFSLNSHLFPSWPGSVLCGGVQGTKPPVTLTSQPLQKDNEGSHYHPHSLEAGLSLSSLLPMHFRDCYREGTQLAKWLWGLL